MSSSSTSSVDLPDKGYLYGNFQKVLDWQCKLFRKASHKALDIPDDDMDLNVRNGMGWKELAVVGAMVLGAAWGAKYFAVPESPAPPAVTVPATPPVDSEYEVRFYDAEGNVIPVPHVNQKPPPGGSP